MRRGHSGIVVAKSFEVTLCLLSTQHKAVDGPEATEYQRADMSASQWAAVYGGLLESIVGCPPDSSTLVCIPPEHPGEALHVSGEFRLMLGGVMSITAQGHSCSWR